MATSLENGHIKTLCTKATSNSHFIVACGHSINANYKLINRNNNCPKMDTSVPLPTLQTLMPLTSKLINSNKKILENNTHALKKKNVIPGSKHTKTFFKLLVFQNQHMKQNHINICANL